MRLVGLCSGDNKNWDLIAGSLIVCETAQAWKLRARHHLAQVDKTYGTADHDTATALIERLINGTIYQATSYDIK